MGSNFKLSTKFVNEFAMGLNLYDPDKVNVSACKEIRNFF